MKRILLILIICLTIMVFSFFIFLSMVGCESNSPKQLDIYVWEGYLPEEAATLFEQETGIKLNIAFNSDFNAALTLLRGGGIADIVMPTNSQVNSFYEDELVQPLDLQIITNYSNVSKFLREQEWTKWDGQQMGSGEIYSVPYVFGTSGISINTSKYTKSLDDTGWDIFLDSDLKGRVSTKNGIASILLILDICGIPRENLITDTEGTLDEIEDEALALKNNVLKFYDTNAEIIDLMKNEEVWIAHIEDANGRKLSQFDSKFRYILPKTGGVGWIDTFMIPKAAVNPNEANIFINFMLRSDIAAIITEQSGFKTTVEDALYNTKNIEIDLYKFTQEQLDKLLWIPNLSEKERSMTSEFWEELTTINN